MNCEQPVEDWDELYFDCQRYANRDVDHRRLSVSSGDLLYLTSGDMINTQ